MGITVVAWAIGRKDLVVAGEITRIPAALDGFIRVQRV
jgi:hypothetical protein